MHTQLAAKKHWSHNANTQTQRLIHLYAREMKSHSNIQQSTGVPKKASPLS